VFPVTTIVVGERGFASWRDCGDGPEQQNKGTVRPLSEQRGHISGGSHPRAHYNVEQPTRREKTFPSSRSSSFYFCILFAMLILETSQKLIQFQNLHLFTVMLAELLSNLVYEGSSGVPPRLFRYR
jgi:hypothetical protein